MITFTLWQNCSPTRCNRCSFSQTTRYLCRNETSLPPLFRRHREWVEGEKEREREYSWSSPRCILAQDERDAMHLPPYYTVAILLRLLRVLFPTLTLLSYLPLFSAYNSERILSCRPVLALVCGYLARVCYSIFFYIYIYTCSILFTVSFPVRCKFFRAFA